MQNSTYKTVSIHTFRRLLEVWSEERTPNENRVRTIFDTKVRHGALKGLLDAPSPHQMIGDLKEACGKEALLKEFCSRFVDMSRVPGKETETVDLDVSEICSTVRQQGYRAETVSLGVFARRARVRHKKKGTVYIITDVPVATELLEADGLPFYSYKSEDEGVEWKRNFVDMEDGRFELIENK